MIVGFTVTDYNGHESEAIAFIQKHCILESAKIADNIVNAGPGVNVFSASLTREELENQPFSCVPIETQNGKYLLVSAVNFGLELLYNSSILKLAPTEYIYILPQETSQFEQYMAQGLVRLFPALSKDGGEWLLETGTWNDDGIWVDTAYWSEPMLTISNDTFMSNETLIKI